MYMMVVIGFVKCSCLALTDLTAFKKVVLICTGYTLKRGNSGFSLYTQKSKLGILLGFLL